MPLLFGRARSAGPAAEPTAPLLSLTEFKPAIDQELSRIYAGWQERAGKVDPVFAELMDRLNAFSIRGGKRLRAYLMYLGYVGAGGTDVPSIIRTAASQELYHIAWLIHDDIIDRDTVRYGGPNITGSYLAQFEAALGKTEGRRMAEAMALLAGDVNISLGAAALLAGNFSAERVLAAARRQQEVMVQLAGGEQLDVLIPTFDLAEVPVERLLRICEFKAARYTFEAPLQLGMMLAGATAAQVAAVAAFAVPVGIAFQVADDLLGTFGNETELGKSVLSDLREGKRTLLVLEAYATATQADRVVLDTTLGNARASYHHLAQVRAIMEHTGARGRVEAMAEQHVGVALAQLPGLQLNQPVETELTRLAHYVNHRRS